MKWFPGKYWHDSILFDHLLSEMGLFTLQKCCVHLVYLKSYFESKSLPMRGFSDSHWIQNELCISNYVCKLSTG